MAKDHLGHRRRLRKKCDDLGHQALTDNELFELILFSVLPRVDTKPIVKRCFAEFKTFAAILNASDAQLLRIKGLGTESVRHIKSIAILLDRISFERIKFRDVMNSWDDIEFFCMQRLSYFPIETFLVIMMDHQHKVIHVESLGEGTINQMTIYPREVLKLALSHDAASVIFVHNHPSGDPRASKDDITMTQSLLEMLQKANIQLYDHLIVAGDHCVSMKGEGLFHKF